VRGGAVSLSGLAELLDCSFEPPIPGAVECPRCSAVVRLSIGQDEATCPCGKTVLGAP